MFPPRLRGFGSIYYIYIIYMIDYYYIILIIILIIIIIIHTRIYVHIYIYVTLLYILSLFIHTESRVSGRARRHAHVRAYVFALHIGQHSTLTRHTHTRDKTLRILLLITYTTLGTLAILHFYRDLLRNQTILSV